MTRGRDGNSFHNVRVMTESYSAVVGASCVVDPLPDMLKITKRTNIES